jgi:hypothetical protein
MTKAKSLIIWTATAGIFLPYTLGSTGKYVIVPLFLPAIIVFFVGLIKGRRRILACDFFILATALWMVAAEIEASGTLSMATASDAIAFEASYMVACAYIFGEEAFLEFTRALKVVAIALILLSMLDTLSGQFLVSNAAVALFRGSNAGLPQIVHGGGDLHRVLFGIEVIRATSTFSHPILFGTFCTLAAALFLYSEKSLFLRAFYVVACLGGCILSISSAPLFAFVIVIFAYSYDSVLQRHSWRWKVFWVTLCGSLCLVVLSVDRPLGFLFNHFTFNPETGYYRLLIWTSAIQYIAMAPLTGDPFLWTSDEILGNSVDSIWLVLSLKYGLPVVLLLLVATVTACVSIGRRGNVPSYDFDMRNMCTGLSLVLSMFVFIGLTVDFWDSLWMFWGMCIGVRASLLEYRQRRAETVRFSGSSTVIRAKYSRARA